MLSHAEIWAGLDALAEQAGLSASGLARRAGLDPTTFNRSKRFSADGVKPRWPSTESLSKALEATGMTLDDFAALAAGRSTRTRSLPLLGWAQAGTNGFFDESGLPLGAGWDEIAFPSVEREGAYALEISGDSMEPLYRDGTRIIVSPSEPVRRGDRVVVKTRGGEVLAKELGRVTQGAIELVSINPAYPLRTLALAEVAWVARIVWASQ